MRWDGVILQGYLYSDCRLIARIPRSMAQRADILGISSENEAFSAAIHRCRLRGVRKGYYCLARSEGNPSMKDE